MSDDLFRARVEPKSTAPPREEWPEEWEGSGAGEPDEILDDLMAPFEQHRRELAARLSASGDAPEAEFHQDTEKMPHSLISESEVEFRPIAEKAPFAPVREPGGAAVTLPSRRVLISGQRSKRPWLIAAALVLAVAAGGAGVTALGATRHGETLVPQAEPTTAAVPILQSAADAAAWITTYVGPGHVIACDVTVCALLRGRGATAGSLIPVQSSLTDVEQADTVAVTDVMRRQLGPGLDSVTATEPLAVFGSGAGTVKVIAVSLSGPDGYTQRMAADRQGRRLAGTALLQNPKISVVGAAKTSLADGLVDSRICTLLAVLGSTHSITVAAFTTPGPGAGPDIPLAGVVISTVDGKSAGGSSTQAAALAATVDAQRAPFSALSTTRLTVGADQGLQILFSQPGPAGLLNAATS